MRYKLRRFHSLGALGSEGEDLTGFYSTVAAPSTAPGPEADLVRTTYDSYAPAPEPAPITDAPLTAFDQFILTAGGGMSAAAGTNDALFTSLAEAEQVLGKHITLTDLGLPERGQGTYYTPEQLRSIERYHGFDITRSGLMAAQPLSPYQQSNLDLLNLYGAETAAELPWEAQQRIGGIIGESQAQYNMQVAKVVALLAAPLAAIAAGAGAAAEGAAAGAAGTATVSGPELAALVESGTVGTSGAFLEAASLSGGAVTYSTLTGELIGAVLPSGATVAFDPAADPFAQMGVEPSQTVIEGPSVTDAPTPSLDQIGDELAQGWEQGAVESANQNIALAEVSGDVAPGTLAETIGDEAAAEYLANAASTLGPESVAAQTWYEQAGGAIKDKLIAAGKAELAKVLQSEFTKLVAGGAPATATSAGGAGAGAYGYEYGTGADFSLYSGEQLQPGFFSSKLGAAAKPLGIGALLAAGLLFAFAGGDDN